MSGAAAADTDDTSWKDGRLVLRRPEIPDSQVARMNVPLTRVRRHILSEIVYDLIAEKRLEDDARLRAQLAQDYPSRET